VSENSAVPPGIEPVESAQLANPGAVAPAPRRLPAALRVYVGGRSVRLRGLRRTPTGLFRLLLILGPGLIATSAGNDAGGIATYSSAGAKFGYQMIWVMLLLTFSFGIVQEMVARLGAATGRGLLDLIRERYGLTWSMLAIAVILVANGGVTVSEFVGVGSAAELMGISRYFAVPAAALLLWALVLFGSYRHVEKLFLLMTLVFFAYPIAAVRANPDWGAVLHGALVPTIHWNADYIFVLVGVLGTTITPYIQVFQQSSVVERGATRKHYGPERLDAYFGAVFSNLMSVSMIIATAATLYVAGQHDIQSAADAAKALEPVMGKSAETMFAIGLLGASLLAGGVLPLATAYAVSEAFGVPKGVSLDFQRGRTFFRLFTGLIVIGATLALVPNIPLVPMMVGIQVLNGVLLPVILIFILLLCNDAGLMGELKNTRWCNFLGWTTFAMIAGAVAVMLVGQALHKLGFNLFG
jgi:Mn2+/Fe2+ NRAMP family transporter